jgi:uncharacterized protein (TIGR02118 family)
MACLPPPVPLNQHKTPTNPFPLPLVPLVQKHWAQYGLTDWQVVEFAAGADGSKPYSVQAILTFKDEESLKSALGSGEAATVFGDVPNFSNKSPVFVAGKVVGSQ